ncbi:hypothetical protein C8J57DRAFT_1460218 [Mycena rebaudengoi]|nr:hypothetical protein C8J57DRAFT_1460218 [Mycena rebaudengoi]
MDNGELAKYRLGYSPQLPYPWRWTTPLALCVFLLLATFIIAINIPLSGYNIVQEFTYRPNDTLPPVLFSNMIPEFFQQTTEGFTPQIMRVGDKFRLNSSVFDWTILEAFDPADNSKPVPTFYYYNNPFSNGCDIKNMTATVRIETQSVTIANTITCYVPTLFRLGWSVDVWSGMYPETVMSDFNGLTDDLYDLPRKLVGLSVTVEPCCDCGDLAVASDRAMPLFPTQPPCNFLPAGFIANQVLLQGSQISDWVGFERQNSTDIFSTLPPPALDGLVGTLVHDKANLAILNTLFHNIFQSLYHIIHRDLGLILENQIYSSPEMYNRSISGLPLISQRDGKPVNSTANSSRASTSNATLMAEWKESVRAFGESDRVPVMSYLRPGARLKPLGSAITSIFVSTFAMLSTIWAVFHIIAGALVRSRTEETRRKYDVEGRHAAVDEWTPYFTNDSNIFPAEKIVLENYSTSIAEMRQSLALVLRSLKTHGMLEGDAQENQMEARGAQETQPFLVQHSKRGLDTHSTVL